MTIPYTRWLDVPDHYDLNIYTGQSLSGIIIVSKLLGHTEISQLCIDHDLSVNKAGQHSATALWLHDLYFSGVNKFKGFSSVTITIFRSLF